jgi:hypothetical protein
MIVQYLFTILSSSSAVHPGLEGVYSKLKRKEKSAGKMLSKAIVGYLADKSGGLLK